MNVNWLASSELHRYKWLPKMQKKGDSNGLRACGADTTELLSSWSCQGISLAAHHTALHKAVSPIPARASEVGWLASAKQANAFFCPIVEEDQIYSFVLLLGHKKKIHFMAAAKLLSKVSSSMTTLEPWGWANPLLGRDNHGSATFMPRSRECQPLFSLPSPVPSPTQATPCRWPGKRREKAVLPAAGFLLCSPPRAWEASC